MKNLSQLCLVALTFLSLCQCSTKNLLTQKSRAAARHAEDISIQNSRRESSQSSRTISMIDSGNHQYRINIFPLDTFSFSLQSGFKGKASMIEVVGMRQEVKKITDSSSFRAEREDIIRYDRKSKSKETTVSELKKLEKKRSTLLMNLLTVGLSGLVIWMCWGIWKQKIRR